MVRNVWNLLHLCYFACHLYIYVLIIIVFVWECLRRVCQIVLAWCLLLDVTPNFLNSEKIKCRFYKGHNLRSKGGKNKIKNKLNKMKINIYLRGETGSKMIHYIHKAAKFL